MHAHCCGLPRSRGLDRPHYPINRRTLASWIAGLAACFIIRGRAPPRSRQPVWPRAQGSTVIMISGRTACDGRSPHASDLCGVRRSTTAHDHQPTAHSDARRRIGIQARLPSVLTWRPGSQIVLRAPGALTPYAASIVSTTRKRALFVIMRSYASATRASGNVSTRGKRQVSVHSMRSRRQVGYPAPKARGEE